MTIKENIIVTIGKTEDGHPIRKVKEYTGQYVDENGIEYEFVEKKYDYGHDRDRSLKNAVQAVATVLMIFMLVIVYTMMNGKLDNEALFNCVVNSFYFYGIICIILY